MNVIEALRKDGVTIPDEVAAKYASDYMTKEDSDKEVAKVGLERDSYKTRAETAEETLRGFEGKDIGQLEKDVAEWKKKAEDAKKDYDKKISERDYRDAIKDLTKDLKFTSNSAKKAFMLDLEQNPLQMRDGKVLGFDDYLKTYKENDADAFVSEQEGSKPSFTAPMSGSASGGNGTDEARARAIMGLPVQTK